MNQVYAEGRADTRAEAIEAAQGLLVGLNVMLAEHATTHKYNCTCERFDPARQAILDYNEWVNK